MLDLEEARDFDAEECRLAREEQKQVKEQYEVIYREKKEMEDMLQQEEMNENYLIAAVNALMKEEEDLDKEISVIQKQI